MKNSKHPMDELFKEEFAHFEVNPSKDFWDNLGNHLEPNALDANFKSALSENEIEPSPEVWEKVKEGMPLNLFLRTKLRWLSRVAAVLVIVMALTLYFMKEDSSETPVMVEEQTPIETTNPSLRLQEVEKPTKTVVAAEAVKPEIKPLPKRKPRIRKVPNPVEEREFDIDEEKIKEILKPLEALPIDAAVAFNPKKAKEQNKTTLNSKPKQVNDTKIAVYPPLKVVEPHEVEQLINSYDKQKKAKDSNN